MEENYSNGVSVDRFSYLDDLGQIRIEKFLLKGRNYHVCSTERK